MELGLGGAEAGAAEALELGAGAADIGCGYRRSLAGTFEAAGEHAAVAILVAVDEALRNDAEEGGGPVRGVVVLLEEVADGDGLPDEEAKHLHRVVVRYVDSERRSVEQLDVLEVTLGVSQALFGVGDRAGAEAVAQAERNVIGLHDLADFFEVGVGEIFLVVSQAPFRMDRSAAGDDAGHPLGGHGHVG